jgi:hypothetical protein
MTSPTQKTSLAAATLTQLQGRLGANRLSPVAAVGDGTRPPPRGKTGPGDALTTVNARAGSVPLPRGSLINILA